MAETTKIAWADATWNPWIGCSKVHIGCTNCYAAAQAGRFGVTWGPHGTRRKTSDGYWKKPLNWNAVGCVHTRVFPSLCDPFERWDMPMLHVAGQRLLVADEEPGRYLPQPTNEQFDRLTNLEKANLRSGVYRHVWMDDLRRDFFGLIDKTPNLDWLLLTKRPENIRRMMDGYEENVWLLYSASDQETLESGLSNLLACRSLAPVIGLSLEPLLGPVDLRAVCCATRDCQASSSLLANDWTHLYMNALTGWRATSMYSGTEGPKLGWVIVGGESGPHARPCALEWIDDIRRQCQTSGVPCFIKQLGSNPVTTNANLWDAPDLGKFIGASWGNTVAGCRINLDDPKGGDPSAWPEDLRVREFPR